MSCFAVSQISIYMVLHPHLFYENLVLLALLPPMWPEKIVRFPYHTNDPYRETALRYPSACKPSQSEGDQEQLELDCHIRQLHEIGEGLRRVQQQIAREKQGTNNRYNEGDCGKFSSSYRVSSNLVLRLFVIDCLNG